MKLGQQTEFNACIICSYESVCIRVQSRAISSNLANLAQSRTESHPVKSYMLWQVPLVILRMRTPLPTPPRVWKAEYRQQSMDAAVVITPLVHGVHCKSASVQLVPATRRREGSMITLYVSQCAAGPCNAEEAELGGGEVLDGDLEAQDRRAMLLEALAL